MKPSLSCVVGTLLLLSALCAPSLRAQVDKYPCWTMEYLELQKKQDPSLEGRLRIQEELLQNSLRDQTNRSGNSMRKTATVITIPVVVHVVFSDIAQDVSDQRIIEQIAVSNRDFAGLNHHGLGAFSELLKADTEIRFCLAQKAPNGAPTTGIERRLTWKTMFTSDSVKFTNSGGLDAWDPTAYFNIWVCHTTGVCWGRFPGTGVDSYYGVVMHHGYFGVIDTTFYHGSGTVNTHEIGHCMNLRHIWADEPACSGTDYVADTPNQANYSSVSTPGVVTDICSPTSPGIMYQNFMDYSSDKVQANFTPNQKARMLACFASPSGPLLPLLASNACSAPSSCEVPTGLRVYALTRTTASVDWTPMLNSISYNIRYKKVSSNTWITTSSSTNSKVLTGLTKNTYYEFQVQNVCGGSSAYSGSKTFQTLKTGPAKENGDVESMPEAFALYPNPASHSTILYYTVDETGPVSITVCDALGREVDRVESPYLQQPGTYTYEYPVSQLTPGVYYLRVVAGTEMETKRLTVSR